MKIHAIYLLYVNDVILSAHNSRQLANDAADRLFKKLNLSKFKYFIEECPLSLKGKREIVSAEEYFGIHNPLSK